MSSYWYVITSWSSPVVQQYAVGHFRQILQIRPLGFPLCTLLNYVGISHGRLALSSLTVCGRSNTFFSSAVELIIHRVRKNERFIAHFQEIVTVKEFRKSGCIWLSYFDMFRGGAFFPDTVYKRTSAALASGKSSWKFGRIRTWPDLWKMGRFPRAKAEIWYNAGIPNDILRL